MSTLTCPLCDKKISSKGNLGRHCNEVHNIDYVVKYEAHLNNYKCLETNCNASFKNTTALRNHLHLEHDIDGLETQLFFLSFEDFSFWLTEEENRSQVQYCRKSGIKISNKGTNETIYLQCVRSGMQPKARNNHKRVSRNSCKIDKMCTSQIIVNKNRATGYCNVTYYKQHYGHDIELQHLKLRKSDTKTIISTCKLSECPKEIQEKVEECVKIESEILKQKIYTGALHVIRNLKNIDYSKEQLEMILCNIKHAESIGKEEHRDKIRKDSKNKIEARIIEGTEYCMASADDLNNDHCYL